MRRIVICSTCRYSADEKLSPEGQTGGEILLGHLNAENGADIEIVTQACLWNCNRPCSVAFQDENRFSYITGGHQPNKAQAKAIIDWFTLHGATQDGVVSFRLWPELMRGHFIARIPPVRP